MDGTQSINAQDEAALGRYKIISPILSAIEENADQGKISLLKAEACGQAGIRKTLTSLVAMPKKGLTGFRLTKEASAKSRASCSKKQYFLGWKCQPEVSRS